MNWTMSLKNMETQSKLSGWMGLPYFKSLAMLLHVYKLEKKNRLMIFLFVYRCVYPLTWFKIHYWKNCSYGGSIRWSSSSVFFCSSSSWRVRSPTNSSRWSAYFSIMCIIWSIKFGFLYAKWEICVVYLRQVLF